MTSQYESSTDSSRRQQELPSAKVKTLDELASLSAQARAQGKRVVLAHGTFDLVHLGHVRHLRNACEHGDILVVTLTADPYVNKGPGRPVFSDCHRAEMLASLSFVDWVGVNDESSSENVIELIKPSVYVKGSDYAQADQDVTGKINVERDAVERNGGKVIFTDEATFSSSELINRHLQVFSDELQQYLNASRENGLLDEVLSAIDRIADLKVLLVGDSIIDEYRYVSTLDKTPKENLVATLYQSEELFAGGVIAAANHVASFCKEVTVLTGLGEAASYEDLIRNSLKSNVNLEPIYRPDLPTVRKCRYVNPTYFQKMFEVYYMDDKPISGELEAAFISKIESLAGDYDLIIVTDFGHGLVTSKCVDTLQRCAPFLAVNTQTNSANKGYNLVTRYSKADYVCIDNPEARMAVSDKYSSLESIAEVQLASKIDCDKMILTHGPEGCVAYDREIGTRRVPAFTRTVVDTVGAGDAFLAVTSPVVASGANMEVAGIIGNAVGAMKVGIVGHRESVEKVPLIRYLQTIFK